MRRTPNRPRYRLVRHSAVAEALGRSRRGPVRPPTRVAGTRSPNWPARPIEAPLAEPTPIRLEPIWSGPSMPAKGIAVGVAVVTGSAAAIATVALVIVAPRANHSGAAPPVPGRGVVGSLANVPAAVNSRLGGPAAPGQPTGTGAPGGSFDLAGLPGLGGSPSGSTSPAATVPGARPAVTGPSVSTVRIPATTSSGPGPGQGPASSSSAASSSPPGSSTPPSSSPPTEPSPTEPSNPGTTTDPPPPPTDTIPPLVSVEADLPVLGPVTVEVPSP